MIHVTHVFGQNKTPLYHLYKSFKKNDVIKFGTWTQPNDLPKAVYVPTPSGYILAHAFNCDRQEMIEKHLDFKVVEQVWLLLKMDVLIINSDVWYSFKKEDYKVRVTRHFTHDRRITNDVLKQYRSAVINGYDEVIDRWLLEPPAQAEHDTTTESKQDNPHMDDQSTASIDPSRVNHPADLPIENVQPGTVIAVGDTYWVFNNGRWGVLVDQKKETQLTPTTPGMLEKQARIIRRLMEEQAACIRLFDGPVQKTQSEYQLVGDLLEELSVYVEYEHALLDTGICIDRDEHGYYAQCRFDEHQVIHSVWFEHKRNTLPFSLKQK